jgi:hypothetical protein
VFIEIIYMSWPIKCIIQNDPSLFDATQEF